MNLIALSIRRPVFCLGNHVCLDRLWSDLHESNGNQPTSRRRLPDCQCASHL